MRGRGARGRRPTNQGRGGKGNVRVQEEIKPVDVVDEPEIGNITKNDSWLNHLPPVEKPDEELHKQLSEERKERRKNKVNAFCKCEVEGILNYAFTARKRVFDEEFYDTRDFRKLRTAYRSGLLTPDPPDPNYRSPKDCFSTELSPNHTLESHHYLHFFSDSLQEDISNVFGVSITDDHVDDPNPMFSENLKQLQNDMQIFQQPFIPYEKIIFPYIICIIGPQSSGRTTIAQFFQKAFDIHIIHVMNQPFYPGKRKNTTAEIEVEPQPEYYLKDAILIPFTDDKTIVSTIVTTMKDNYDGKGFLISGYPTAKNQLVLLEKALAAANIGSSGKSSPKSSPRGSTRGKAKNVINGLIFTSYNDPERERIVDPETGNVYKRGFHMPCIADLIEHIPTHFRTDVQIIKDRLQTLTAPEYPILNPKQVQEITKLEAAMKKIYKTILIPPCENISQVLESLDTFLLDLFKNNEELLPPTPFMTLIHPSVLIKPGLCFTAIQTWHDCLEKFGRGIADQSNLASTLPNKLDVLIHGAIDRYQLLISQKDTRDDLCDKFMSNLSDFGNQFILIWELSLKVRNHNFDLIDDVIDKSGLIELLLEIRKSPKMIFIALIQKIFFTKWFYDSYVSELLTKDEFSDQSLFTELQMDRKPLPDFDFQLTIPLREFSLFKSSAHFNIGMPPLDVPSLHLPSVGSSLDLQPQTSRPSKPKPDPLLSVGVPLTSRRTKEDIVKERRHLARIRGFDYLLENIGGLEERPQDDIFFDANKVCMMLNILPFDSKTSFDDTLKYAEDFFEHLLHQLDNKLLLEEVRATEVVFKKFTTLCKRKETSMVNAVFDLRDSLITYTYSKCTREMEIFTRRIRYLRKYGTIDQPLFEYDFKEINPEIENLAYLMNSFEVPIIVQKLVQPEEMFKIAQEAEARNMRFASATEFLQMVNDIMPEEDNSNIELCLRILECVECFDIKKFLMSFCRFREDEKQLFDIMPDPEPVIEIPEPTQVISEEEEDTNDTSSAEQATSISTQGSKKSSRSLHSSKSTRSSRSNRSSKSNRSNIE